ncbi:MAG: phage holin family protein [Proteobacteria bacterium]|nr:phage holin family protein [Pseudomonadota bacterium]
MNAAPRSPLAGLLVRGAFAALGLWVATYFVTGLHFQPPSRLVFAGLLLGLVNAFLRPLLILLTLPFTLLTFGLFLLVINAAMVAFVAWLLPGMHVDGFGAAFATALIVSLVGWIGAALAR